MTHKVTLAGRFRKRLSPLFLSVMFNGNILHPFIQWVIFAYSHAPPKNVIASPVFFFFRHCEECSDEAIHCPRLCGKPPANGSPRRAKALLVMTN